MGAFSWLELSRFPLIRFLGSLRVGQRKYQGCDQPVTDLWAWRARNHTRIDSVAALTKIAGNRLCVISPSRDPAPERDCSTLSMLRRALEFTGVCPRRILACPVAAIGSHAGGSYGGYIIRDMADGGWICLRMP